MQFSLDEAYLTPMDKQHKTEGYTLSIGNFVPTHLETDVEIYNYPTEKKGVVTNPQQLQIAIKMILFLKASGYLPALFHLITITNMKGHNYSTIILFQFQS